MAEEIEDRIEWIETFDVTDLGSAFNRTVQAWTNLGLSLEPERREMIPNSAVLTIPNEEAEHQIELYADLPELTEREKNMLAIYDSVLAGEKVIKLSEILRNGKAGSWQGTPNVALAPVTAESVVFTRDYHQYRVGFKTITNTERVSCAYRADYWEYKYEASGYDSYRHALTKMEAEALAPLIPPQHRDKVDEDQDLLLWEPVWLRQSETMLNPDPAIIRPLSNGLYRVIAAWDLTPVEAMLLSDK